MKLHADAVAFFIDRHAPQLLVESGVLDGDRRLRRERPDSLLVVAAKFGVALLLGEVEVAERDAAEKDRRPEEARHRGVILGKTDRLRVVADPTQAKRRLLVLQHAE